MRRDHEIVDFTHWKLWATSAIAFAAASVLPESGDCYSEPTTNAVTGMAVDEESCWYEPGLVLALTRLTEAETWETLRAAAQDPEIKKLMTDIMERMTD